MSLSEFRFGLWFHFLGLVASLVVGAKFVFRFFGAIHSGSETYLPEIRNQVGTKKSTGADLGLGTWRGSTQAGERERSPLGSPKRLRVWGVWSVCIFSPNKRMVYSFWCCFQAMVHGM